MIPTFWAQVKETFIQLVKISFPLILLAGILSFFDVGVLVGGAIALALTLLEIRIIMKSTLPWISDVFSFLLSDSSSPPDEYAIVEAATHLKEQHDAQGLLNALKRYTDENPKLLRAWLFRVSSLCDAPLYRYDNAVDTLKEALVAKRWSKEEKAMLLFKIAHIYELHLENLEKAAAYYSEASIKFPRTAYGKKADEKLVEIS